MIRTQFHLHGAGTATPAFKECSGIFIFVVVIFFFNTAVKIVTQNKSQVEGEIENDNVIDTIMKSTHWMST